MDSEVKSYYKHKYCNTVSAGKHLTKDAQLLNSQ